MSTKTSYIIQICSASISLMASSTMSVIICTSPKGLDSPYQRIVFGLSCSDIIQSLSIIIGPFTSPKGTALAPWSRGNNTTCAISGFLATNAFNFVPMYTCCLCIYYVCKLRRRMSDDTLSKRVEWILHLGIVLINLPLTTSALALDTYHPSPVGFCYYAEYPTGCRNPGNEFFGQCTKGKHRDFFAFFGGMVLPSISFLGIVVCSLLLSQHAVAKTREFRAKSLETNHHGRTPRAGVPPAGAPPAGIINNVINTAQEPPTPRRYYPNLVQRQRHESEVQYWSRLYRKDCITQALLFVLSFTVVYVAPAAGLALSLIRDDAGNIEDKIGPLVLALIFPLGGLFNILIYCRPKVAALRRREDSISWIRGFILVIAAGGEIPESISLCRTRGSNKDSTKNQQEEEDIGSGINEAPGKGNCIESDNHLISYASTKENIKHNVSNLSGLGVHGLSESFRDGDHIDENLCYIRGESNVTREGDGILYHFEPESIIDITYARNMSLNTEQISSISGLSLDAEICHESSTAKSSTPRSKD